MAICMVQDDAHGSFIMQSPPHNLQITLQIDYELRIDCTLRMEAARSSYPK